MKKFLTILLAVLMCMACMSFASAEKAGDTVTIPINLNNSDAVYVKISVSYDTSAFELVSFSSDGTSNGTTFNMSNINGVPSGKCASITLRVTENAVPGQTYSISAKVKEAWTIDETAANASASGGSVTIDKAPEPTDAPTTEPTDAPTTEPTDAPTTEPTDAPTTEPTDAPTTEPTDAPTTEPTDAPTAKPTAKPTQAPSADVEEDDDVPKTGANYAGYVIASIGMMLALVYLVLRRVIRSK